MINIKRIDGITDEEHNQYSEIICNYVGYYEFSCNGSVYDYIYDRLHEVTNMVDFVKTLKYNNISYKEFFKMIPL